MSVAEIENAASPGLGRRLAAIFYDTWLIIALWLLGATLDFFVQRALGLGDAPYRLPLQLYLAACPFVFFGWFWTHGGQTLGMRSWRIKVLDAQGREVTWRQSIMRVAVALFSSLAFGLGHLWMLIDPDRLTWHDRLSGTRLVMLKKA